MLGSSQDADREPDIARAVAAIESYIAAYPAAADNAQGVAQWWLPEMGVDLPVDIVHRALDLLWRRGALERNVLPDGGVVYRGNRTGAQDTSAHGMVED